MLVAAYEAVKTRPKWAKIMADRKYSPFKIKLMYRRWRIAVSYFSGVRHVAKLWGQGVEEQRQIILHHARRLPLWKRRQSGREHLQMLTREAGLSTFNLFNLI